MEKLFLFTDGSVDTPTHIGYGAYLLVNECDLSLDPLPVQVKRFESTSSSKLELQTLLWALTDRPLEGYQVVVHTDAQNILSLLERRDRLERNNYHSSQNKPLLLGGFYREFFEITDQLDCHFIKVRGHQRSDQKDQIDRLFTMVDRAARKALRKNIKENGY